VTKGKERTAPIILTSLEKPTQAELRRRYEETNDAETRTRSQMLLLSLQGKMSSQIAQIVLRSQETVVRVLKRFLSDGLDAVPRRTAPGRERTITAAWEAELLRVIEGDPHEVGQETANWTTKRLAKYLGQQTGIQVTEETVRVSLHAHDDVWKRSTWTLRRKAEEKADDVGNACGERFFSPGQASPNLSPLKIWVRLISGISFPPIWLISSPCCPTLMCICKMRCRWRFIRPSPVSGRAKDDVGSV
jgi:transposase